MSSSSLRRQREAALKRRSQNSENDSFISNSLERPQTSSSSHHRNAAMADAFAWEEIKTKERIEQREQDEQIRREEEARMAQKQREEEESRRLELQRFEQEQELLEQELALKKNEAAQRLEEESRRLAEAKAEAEKIEKDRLDTEAANKRAELERMEAELIQERQKVKFEADQLAEERRKEEQRRRQSAGSTTSGKGEDNNEDAYGQYSDGGNNGYQRYLTSFHQTTEETKDDDNVEEGATVISELTDVNSPTELKLNSKMQQSTSSRSLPFNKVNEAQITSINDVNLDDPNDMRTFLMRPCPKGDGMIQCCIRRNKGIKNALFPEYRIYLKSSNGKTETFLMTSKKRVGNKTSNYLISMSRNDHDKTSDGILGKLRSNFLGTEYMIYDHGKNPEYDDSYYDEKNDGMDIRCELGAIMYGANTSLGSKGPRKMKVCFSKVDDNGNPAKVWQPTKKGDGMTNCYKQETSDADKLACLENKPPEWNDEVGAYVLNFNGKVTMASVKNFQLINKEDDEKIMQFGRIGNNDFHLDVKWPMSLYQAFAVALSSFDSKLGCD